MELFKQQILKYTSRRDYSPLKKNRLAQEMGVPDARRDAFNEALNSLCDESLLVINHHGEVALPAMTNRVIGNYRANPRGFGFVIPFQANSYGDLFVSHNEAMGAMTGDTVVARPMKRGKRAGQDRYAGRIIEILQRGHERIVGTLKKYPHAWVVEPDGNEFVEPVIVEDVSAKNAKEDDKVVLDIVNYPTENHPGRGAIVEVLGRAGLYDAEIASAIVQFSLPGEFPDECRDQARDAAANFNPLSDPIRDDITDEMILTIDPPDAKDFDDAISLKKDTEGNWILGIHIADVSSFIPINSPLDEEARERGNSVYLPGKVIPMLPEVLSNGICSLQPNQKRFAKSVYITYDAQGNIQSREFANSIIESKARLTYEQADCILKGKVSGFAPEVVALLKDMETLARAIEARRQKAGMLHLDLPEVELQLDDEGKVIDAHPADDSYPHTIIEMFMVEANDAVAAMLDRFGVPFMRRIHPEPDTFNVKKLGQFVRICGMKLPKMLDRPAMQALLESVKGKGYAYAINMYVLRCMQKAEYSPMHVGHFALASTHYCHFTSPIRRYADLMVHRLIDLYVKEELNKIGLEEVLPEQQLVEIGKHISFTEQQAERAERDLKAVLILEMLSDHIGEELDCVVSGLTTFGIFAQCQKYGIEGMIEFGDLGMDEWKYNEKQQCVVGAHSGKHVRLGDKIRVRIATVNVAARHLYIAPAEPLVESTRRIKSVGGGKKRKRKKPRGHARKLSKSKR